LYDQPAERMADQERRFRAGPYVARVVLDDLVEAHRR
jgi:hypothetical protein